MTELNQPTPEETTPTVDVLQETPQEKTTPTCPPGTCKNQNTYQEKEEHPSVATIFTLSLLSFLFPVLAFFTWPMSVKAQKEEKERNYKPSPLLQSSKVLSVTITIVTILGIILYIAFFSLFLTLIATTPTTYTGV